MAFVFKNLTTETRELMQEEVHYDLERKCLYYSDRLSEHGKELYAQFLLKSIETGNEEALANSLVGCFNACYQRRNPKGGYSLVKMPSNAAQMLAEGEYNRFYIRALCRTALVNNKKLKIYRAKLSYNPRIESEIKIGQFVDAKTLLDDLRNNIGFETVLKIPQPNSGLSVELVD